MKASPGIRVWAALLAVYIVWGSTYLAIRFAVESMPPFLMAGVRFLLAGAILFIWRRLAGDPWPQACHWRSAAVVGMFLLLGGNGGVVWAEQRVASGIAALLVGAVPLWMVGIDALRPQGARPRWATLLGVLIGLAGIALLVGPSDLSGGGLSVDLLGVLALLLATLLWAVGSLYSRAAPLPASALLGASMEMLAGGAGLLILGTLTGEWGRLDLASITPRAGWGLAYLIVFGSLVGFAAYTWLLRNAPTPLVSTYAYVNPLVAIVLGNLLGQEALSPRLFLAAAIIISAVFLINTSRAALTQPKAPATTCGDD
jgi:drug/metabolite transporter (DMT)-like permease